VFSRETVEAFEFPKVMLLVAAAALLLALTPWTRPSRALLTDPLRLGVVLFVLSAVVSTALSRAPWISLQGGNESYFGLLTILAYVMLFFATRALCRSAQDARRLVLAPVVAAGVAAGYALVQLGGVDPILYGRTAGMGAFVRPFATMGHPNFLSAFLVMALPLVALALVRALRQGQPIAATIFAVIAVLSGVAVAVTVSRGAWLALAAAAAIFVAGALTGGAWRAAAVTASVAGATALALGLLALVPGGAPVVSGVIARVRQLTDSASRLHIWRAAWGLFRDHPVTGTGLDTFQIAFADKRTPAYWAIEWNSSPTRAHNEALNLLATQGALGGLAVLVFTAGVLLALGRALRAAGDRLLVVALAAGVAAFYVQDLFSFTVAGCGTLVVTQAALLSRLAERERAESEDDGTEPLVLALAAGVLVAIVTFAHNLTMDLLLDQPARLAGALVVLAAVLAGAAAVFALEQHGRPPAFASGWRAAGGSRRRALATTLCWGLALVLLLGLVLRPLIASRAARAGGQAVVEQPALAAEQLQRAVALEPFVELYWVRLGSASHAAARSTRDAAERGRRLEDARAAYERALSLVRANSYNHANLGRALADLARDGAAAPGEAFARFDRALELDPNNAYFYADAATASLLVGDVDRAREYASRGVALYPRFAPPRSLLGHIELTRRHVPEAAELLQAAVDGEWHEVNGRAGAAANLAAAYIQLDRPARAEQAARLALSLAPASPEARFNLAKALERQGRRDEAIAEYRRLPDFEPARHALRALGAS
jgi:O-antigen ligase/Flp pilus assembly protein TadD